MLCAKQILYKDRQPLREGRLLHWSPSDAAVEGSKKAVPASHPGVCARFVKETALQKQSALLPDIDMIDCTVKQEPLKIAAGPIMLQLPLQPSYALTVHKTQATLCVLECCLCA